MIICEILLFIWFVLILGINIHKGWYRRFEEKTEVKGKLWY